MRNLIAWYIENKRDLPWRDTNDPYRIWISEIILQQTRVEQGKSYYVRFIQKFPDVFALADADEFEVLKIWEGLGYYTRARNMHDSAKKIVHIYKGVFPDKYDEIIQLKGVGEYTAAAIASIAFKLPYVVVDGNVMRVLSRYFAVKESIDTSLGKKIIKGYAEFLLDKNRPDVFNQAIMELGALVCVPKNPNCTACPVNLECSAYITGKTNLYPVRTKKIKQKNRYFNYFLIANNNELLVEKRKKNDIWKNLYQLPLFETSKQLDIEEVIDSDWLNQLLLNTNFKRVDVSGIVKHKLSHQNIYSRFFYFNCNNLQDVKNTYMLIPFKEIKKFAFPKLIVNYFSSMNLFS